MILFTSGTVIKRVSRVPGGIFRHTFLSINRFEKKKNIALAIEAFATLVRQQEDSQLSSVPRKLVRLVVAGGLPAANFSFFTCYGFHSWNSPRFFYEQTYSKYIMVLF